VTGANNGLSRRGRIHPLQMAMDCRVKALQ
jgi:hypothetical protein